MSTDFTMDGKVLTVKQFTKTHVFQSVKKC